jgi:Flp pilus assembly protein TadG
MILPLLFTFLIGVFWFGQAFHIYTAITNAARDGARAAAAPDCTTCSGTDPSTKAWNVIKADLQAAHINPNLLQPPTNPPSLCACTPTGVTTGCTSTTVLCDGSETNICVQGVNTNTTNNPPTYTVGGVQLSSTVAPSAGISGGAGECGISVSFQYPYSFWLPGTSLNQQQLYLRAQAQMRVENQ